MDVIICHINADFDCLSSMLGAKKLYNEAVPVFPGSQEKKVREFIQVFNPFEVKKVKDININNIKRLILVDTKSPSRIGPFKDIALTKRAQLHVYDHHPVSGDDLKGVVEVIEDVGATATIFTEIVKEHKMQITPLEATVLCLGIYEETGSLRFPSTTERDLIAVAYLLRRGANLNIVSEYIKAELTKEELKLLNDLVSSAKDIFIYNLRIRIVKAVRNEYIGDIAHLAHRIMDMEEIDALIMLVSMEGKVIIVGRSRVPEFNVAEVLGEFGGGGHALAASATIEDGPLEVIEERLTEKIKGSVRPLRLVKDIMTAPVITIQENITIKDAESIMTKYSVNVLPILQGVKFYGILSREIVEKAIFHGFGKSRVSEFATTDAKITHPDTPVTDIESVMIEQNQRFMSVIKDGRIVGAITRTDLLRNLYEETLRRNRIEQQPMLEKSSISRNIAGAINERFPEELTFLLKTAGAVAESLGCNAYLVGGSVRDIIRGEKNLDIDIVIEGNGIDFAKSLSSQFKGVKLVVHKRFKTAKLSFRQESELKMPFPDFTVDIATARTEYYEEPATLPKVETSSIKKDLYRRDFTINTLAVKLNAKEFGFLIDFFGAQRDIREKTIRVLHNLSFVEDPTRAFRAIRFAERFGFKISKHTENLIKSALRMNLFKRVSGSRLYDELILTFKETEPVKALKSLAHYGLLAVVHPELRLGDALEGTLQAIHDSLAWFGLLFLKEEINRSKVYIMGLLTGLSRGEQMAALQRLSTPPRDMEVILKDIETASSVIKLLKTSNAVKIYYMLKQLDLETILYSMAISKNNVVQKAISRYLLELRNVKPLLTGNDLKRMGIEQGPIYSEILNALLELKLKGLIKDRDDEIEYVRGYLKNCTP